MPDTHATSDIQSEYDLPSLNVKKEKTTLLKIQTEMMRELTELMKRETLAHYRERDTL